jgi:SAM-dependent methyltransferase
MKHWITIIYLFIITQLSAEGSLRNLIEYDKTTCIEQLKYATKEELWDAFLEGQLRLFYNSEFQWLQYKDWWQQSKSILEIGSGNGIYLAKLADHFPEKTFCGLEKLPFLVVQSNEHFAHNRLIFEAWDAEELNIKLINSADIVLFRLTLQHLENPLIALNNAWQYLVSNGHVVIIDSFDLAKKVRIRSKRSRTLYKQ